MSKPSSWVLNKQSTRYIIPQSTVEHLSKHPITSKLYPTSMGFYKNAYGHKVERSLHNDWLLLYCVEGSAYLKLKDRGQAIKKGSLILLPSGTYHKYYADEKDPWSIYWTHLYGQNAQEIFQYIDPTDIGKVISLSAGSKIVTDFENFIKSFKMGNHIYATLCLYQLLGYIGLLNRNKVGSSVNMNAEQFHTYMVNNIKKNITLDDMALHFHTSKFYLSRSYKKIMGQSPMADFTQLKIQKACQYLDLDQMTIKEVSYELGFSDPLYFRKVFKKIMGFTPGEYKKLKRG